ncbi:putative ankyrin repeat-containing domain superfamily [Helianthus anomalus]
MQQDNSGFSALHVAARTKSTEIVNEVLSLPDTIANVNALARDHKIALDIAKSLPLSSVIIACLTRCGAVRTNELNQRRDELRNMVTQIKKDVHAQLLQTKKTNQNVWNCKRAQKASPRRH